jgi:hypothetical protein
MTFEEAVATPGRIVQLCGSDMIDGNRVQAIYCLTDDGAKELAWRAVPADKYDAVVEELRARGLAVAETEPVCCFIWIISADGIEVYGMYTKLLDATGGRAEVEGGRTIQRSDIARVISFSEQNYVYRGVKAELSSGEEVPMVVEVSMAAEAGAGYSRNDFIMETGWAGTLGVAIANWAGVPFHNHILD